MSVSSLVWRGAQPVGPEPIVGDHPRVGQVRQGLGRDVAEPGRPQPPQRPREQLRRDRRRRPTPQRGRGRGIEPPVGGDVEHAGEVTLDREQQRVGDVVGVHGLDRRCRAPDPDRRAGRRGAGPRGARRRARARARRGASS